MLNDIKYNIKSCNIIYGYTESCISQYNDSIIILIEPRKDVLDKISKLKLDNIILIKKVLVCEKSLSETVLYYDKLNDNYWLEKNNLSINGTNFFNITKELVYTISLVDLIIQYKIQNIKNLVFNINIANNDLLLKSIEQFNHIISYIKLKTDFQCEFFNKFYKETSENLDYIVYAHKNLQIKLPKIGIYFNDLNLIADIDKLTLLLNQYRMSLIITERDTEINIIEYPESINKLIDLYKKSKSNIKKNTQPFYNKIIEDLDIIFNKKYTNKIVNEKIQKDRIEKVIENQEKIENEEIENIENRIENINIKDEIKNEIENKVEVNFDIIIQFNAKYFEINNTLQIMYPLKNNIIYINKTYDIIYATKNCMYMLYQIIKSKYFSDYLDNKKKLNPKLFKLMSKRYFYEYIDKIFHLKYF